MLKKPGAAIPPLNCNFKEISDMVDLEDYNHTISVSDYI